MFESAKQKIDRANYHIADLIRQTAAFIAEKPHRFVIESDPITGALLVKIKFLKEPPVTLALVIADAIHNLRTALDHIAWELAAIGNGTQDRHTSFPTGDNRINFESRCNGIVTPSQWVKDAFKSLEAFPGGKGHELYNLSELDNADKHTVITPVMRATGHPPIRASHPQGRLVVMERNTFIGGASEGRTLASFAPGTKIELEDDAECPPSIFFPKPDHTIEPAWSMMRGFAVAVGNALKIIEEAVLT